MLNNPIVQRELVGLVRSRQALWMQVAMAVVLVVLVLLRWPADPLVDLAGDQARQVFQLFAYGLMSTALFLVPAFPATSIVREKLSGTLALLINSPMPAWSIFAGKLVGVMGMVVLLLMASIPAAVACYVMAGVSLVGGLLPLYGLLLLVSLQYATLGLLISTYAGTTDAAMRLTYGLVLTLSVVCLLPFLFLQAQPDWTREVAVWLRACSPIPPLMEILRQSDVGSQGLMAESSLPRFLTVSLASVLLGAIWTTLRLNWTIFDRNRSQGLVTDERSVSEQRMRRRLYLVDPQRRKSGIGNWTNPVMVKEFRCRRFGRLHWVMRMMAACSLVSLGLTFVSTTGTEAWGTSTIGGIMVLLQVALVVVLTPGLAAGLISSERESGGWQLLQMTPLSSPSIVLGKLLSVILTLALVVVATLPGYLVMVWIDPAMWPQIYRVLICLALTTVLALTASAAVSSLVRRTATATAISFAILLAWFGGTLLFWLGEGAPFGRGTVTAILRVNLLAAALEVIGAPGFDGYHLLPTSWWIAGGASLVFLAVLVIQTRRLTRPQ